MKPGVQALGRARGGLVGPLGGGRAVPGVLRGRGPGGAQPANELTFLRGVQITDAHGVARFTTIYPGWYPGRTVHIHLKVRTTAAPTGAYEFTSQLFFEDALTDEIHARSPYAAHGRRTTTNAADGIYRDGGQPLTLEPVTNRNGLAATFGIGLDLSHAATGRPDGNGAATEDEGAGVVTA